MGELNENSIMKILDQCYEKCLNGVSNVSPPIDKFAEDYLSKNPQPYIAAEKMINNQVLKCATSGFISGFGGILTLPVSIPANVGTVLYVQMRMIACCAYMAGFDLKSDQVQTFVYACLAGVSVNEIIKKTAVKFGEKVTVKTIEKIPGKVLTKINQAVGFRFLTKFGEKGLINMGKAVPVVGATICGGLDLSETRIIGNRAYKVFIENDISGTDANDDKKIDLKEVGSKIVGGVASGSKVIAKGATSLADKGISLVGDKIKKKK